MRKFNAYNVCNNALLALFPIKIWRIILFHVDKYYDYVQISSSSSLFKGLLQPNRTTFLFRNICKVLSKREYKPGNTPPVKNYLVLRLVSSSWKNGVDSVHHNLSSPYLSDYCAVFAKEKDVQKFWRDFSNENSAVNTFLHRSVCLCFTSLEMLPKYYSQLLEMLHKFGHQIWYLRIDIMAEDNNLMNHVLQILQQVPNLRRLHFVNALFDRPSPQVELSQTSLYRLQFPTLKRLVSLGEFSMPPAIIQKILESNPQIRWMNGKFSERILEAIPNVDGLSILIANRSDWANFYNVKAISPLTYLKIEFWFGGPFKSLLFVVNRHFGKTLQEIEIVSKNFSHFTQPNFAEFDSDTFHLSEGILKNLTKLTWHTEMAVCLDFLLPLQETLEYLEIVISENNYTKLASVDENVVKFYQFGSRIAASNIWQLFGNLKCVSFTRKPKPTVIYNRQ